MVVVAVALALVASAVCEMTTVGKETCCCLLGRIRRVQSVSCCYSVNVDSSKGPRGVQLRRSFLETAAPPPSAAKRTSTLTYDTGVQVNASDPLVGAGNEQLAQDELLDGENDTVLAAQSDGCTRVVYCLVGVLDLIMRRMVCSMRGREAGLGELARRAEGGRESELTWKMRPSGE